MSIHNINPTLQSNIYSFTRHTCISPCGAGTPGSSLVLVPVLVWLNLGFQQLQSLSQVVTSPEETVGIKMKPAQQQQQQEEEAEVGGGGGFVNRLSELIKHWSLFIQRGKTIQEKWGDFQLPPSQIIKSSYFLLAEKTVTRDVIAAWDTGAALWYTSSVFPLFFGG